jgi:hypothetical protein
MGMWARPRISMPRAARAVGTDLPGGTLMPVAVYRDRLAQPVR